MKSTIYREALVSRARSGEASSRRETGGERTFQAPPVVGTVSPLRPSLASTKYVYRYSAQNKFRFVHSRAARVALIERLLGHLHRPRPTVRKEQPVEPSQRRDAALNIRKVHKEVG